MKLTNKTMKSPINHHSIWPHGLVRTINFTALALLLFTGTSLMAGGREADLPSPLCDSLNVPAGNRISSHVYAKGVQIYRWNGTSWVFVAPDATLYADPCFNGEIGTHYAGPTWEAEDGSKVVAARVADCTPGPRCHSVVAAGCDFEFAPGQVWTHHSRPAREHDWRDGSGHGGSVRGR